MAGILCTKLEMTRIIKGNAFVPVTLLSIPEIRVAQVKTKERDGYEAVVLEALINKNSNKREFARDGKLADVKVGDIITIDLLDGVETVVLEGVSKGKGFAGAMKRWNFHGGPGRVQSKFHRSLGSIGTRKKRRTMKGKKMHGHMGLDVIKLKNIPVELINKDLRVIGVKGPVPGARHSLIALDF
jgi:large subunit ribosomal protein L3